MNGSTIHSRFSSCGHACVLKANARKLVPVSQSKGRRALSGYDSRRLKCTRAYVCRNSPTEGFLHLAIGEKITHEMLLGLSEEDRTIGVSIHRYFVRLYSICGQTTAGNPPGVLLHRSLRVVMPSEIGHNKHMRTLLLVMGGKVNIKIQDLGSLTRMYAAGLCVI